MSQEVDAALTRVTNRICWRLGGLRLAAGAPAVAAPPRRLAYRFDMLSLYAGERAVQLAALPLGAKGPGGWSDTTYVDADTRIARNSRGDLLIFQRSI